MRFETVRDYCLRKKDATEDFPFGETTLVFRVDGKMFALVGLDERPFWINLKCDPERAVELREMYEGVRPGYHMNKRHWNTVVLDGTIPLKEIYSMIDHSYELVVTGKRKKR